MEHASRAVAHLAAGLGRRGAVVVLCGPGNNGGDGYGAARFLASWGLPVRVLALAPAGRGDASREAILAPRAEPVWERPETLADRILRAGTLVDAIFGVGLHRDLEPPFPAWIAAINASPAFRLAVDVPSGLDADTGALRPVAVRADLTATMAAPKVGFTRTAEARAHVGRVVEVDIGLPRSVHARFLLDGDLERRTEPGS
jgi:NAD(P)H-hydrate epimerase